MNKRVRFEGELEDDNQTILPLRKKQKISQQPNGNELYAVIEKGSEQITFKSNNSLDEFTIPIEEIMNWIKTRNIITIPDDSCTQEQNSVVKTILHTDSVAREGLSKSDDNMIDIDVGVICPGCKVDMQYEGDGFTYDGCRNYFCEYCVDHDTEYGDDSDDTPETYTYCQQCDRKNK